MRKTALLAGSALAVAGVAAGIQDAKAAEVSVGMYMPFIIGGADSDNKSENQIGMTSTDTEFYIDGSHTLENGIRVQAKFQLQASESNGGSVDENKIQVDGSFGRIDLGHEDGAEDLMNYGATKVKAFAFGSFANTTGSPVDFTEYSNAATSNEAGLDSGDAVKINYFTPRFSGFQAGVTWANSSVISTQNPSNNSDHLGAGVNYQNTFGEVDVALGGTYYTVASSDAERWSVGTVIGFGNFSVAGQYSDGTRATNQDVKTWDVGVGYSTGPWAASLTYEYGEAKNLTWNSGTIAAPVIETTNVKGEAQQVSAELSYAMGPGITVGAGLTFGKDEGINEMGGDADKDYAIVTTGIVVSF